LKQSAVCGAGVCARGRHLVNAWTLCADCVSA